MGNEFDQSKGELQSSTTDEGRKERIGDAESPENIHQMISDSDSNLWSVPSGNAMQSKVVQASQLILRGRKYRQQKPSQMTCGMLVRRQSGFGRRQWKKNKSESKVEKVEDDKDINRKRVKLADD